MDPVEDDDLRHREEERRRREKRKASRHSKSESQREKEAKRREHAQRILKEQNAKLQAQKSKQQDDAGSGDGSSVFQKLFAKRSEGFVIEFNFRNAPPRPPVGPCFVGLGLDGELSRLAKYRDNTVEKAYVYKLHGESDLGVPLAPHALDVTSYKDPSPDKNKNNNSSNNNNNNARDKHKFYVEDDDDDTTHPTSPPPLPQEDQDLLNWTGSLGDTAAEQLQISRDRKRAEARAIFLANGKLPARSPSASTAASTPTIRRAKKESRVLDEKTQSWMKKTTYLTNDPNASVHKFTSLANTKKRTAEQVDQLLKKAKQKVASPEQISKTFELTKKDMNRRHPTKPHLKPVSDLPLVPDVETWGHTYTHVVIDNPPKALPGSNRPPPSMQQLDKAWITDVQQKKQTARMTCNLLVPSDDHVYESAQMYDLDVVPLKEEANPHVNFLLVIDEEKGVTTYHPVSSRVMLSTGRPGKGGVQTIVEKREMEEEDVKEMEIRMAEVDVTLAEKYDLA